MVDAEIILNKLREYREDAGLTLRAVEKITGISNAYISQVENGRCKNPSFIKVVKLLKAYKYNISFWLDGSELCRRIDVFEKESRQSMMKDKRKIRGGQSR